MTDSATITLDDFLSEQGKIAPLVTIELIADIKDKVKITPWVQGKGCSCSISLVILKSCIESVEVSAHIHQCGEKYLPVVSINLKSGATIALSDVLAQLSVGAINRQEHDVLPKASHPLTPLPYQLIRDTAPNSKFIPDSVALPCGTNWYNPLTQCCCCLSPEICYVKDKTCAGVCP